jgi:hypothetical protein
LVPSAKQGGVVAKTVIGLIDNIGAAQAAVRDLVASGIAQEDIGFMADQRHDIPGTAHLNEGEGAVAGAQSGTGADGLAELAHTLVRLAGSLVSGLTNLGVPEEEAHHYAEGLRRGGILVTVAADQAELADLAGAILQRHGAVDIDQRAAEWKKQGWKGRFEASGAAKPAKRVRKNARDRAA